MLPEETFPMENTRSTSLDALVEVFRRHPSYSRLMEHTPGLGSAIPWTVVECSHDTFEATGLVVRGSLESGAWDLCGSFRLFTTDFVSDGEVLTIQGWCGEVAVCETRADRPASAPTPDWDDLFSNPESRVRAFRAALDAYPKRGELMLRTPLLGVGVPWIVVRLGGLDDAELGLVVVGDVAKRPNGSRDWNLDRPFQVFVTPRGRPPEIVPVDPSSGQISVDCAVPADPCYDEEPAVLAVLGEMTDAMAAWSARSDLVAAWTRRAAVEGLRPAPGRYVELTFGSEVYRGLEIAGPDGDDTQCDWAQPIILMLPSGRIVELDAAQADRHVMVGGHDHVVR
jgi:hypothetical protein